MKHSLIAGLALALTLGMSTVSEAQQRRGPGQGGRDGMAMLFRGIELTDAQKEQLKALRGKQGPAARGREQFEKQREEARALREKGDTAGIRKLREEARDEMRSRNEQMLKDVRSILTPAQREVFEKNIAEAGERMHERREDMRERRDGDGQRKRPRQRQF